MKYSAKPKDTCSTRIEFDLEGDVVRDICFTGGCNGNLQAVQRLLEGFTVEQIEEKCGGILCGRRPTSCADQLAQAVRKAYNQSQKSQETQNGVRFAEN